MGTGGRGDAAGDCAAQFLAAAIAGAVYECGEGADEPPCRLTTYVYDADGRLSRVEDGWGRTNRYDQGGRCLGSDAGAGQGRPRPTAAPTPRLARTFAFRLCGAETQEQTLALEGLDDAAALVAIQRVQASVRGAGQALLACHGRAPPLHSIPTVILFQLPATTTLLPACSTVGVTAAIELPV